MYKRQGDEVVLIRWDGLVGLFGRAGQGDTVLLEQLNERPHWGATNSNAAADPNPRLEAAIDAARRGADVSLLLDSFFDDAGSAVGNAATCAYVTQLAGREGLRLRCQTGNPTGLEMCIRDRCWVGLGRPGGGGVGSRRADRQERSQDKRKKEELRFHGIQRSEVIGGWSLVGDQRPATNDPFYFCRSN